MFTPTTGIRKLASVGCQTLETVKYAGRKLQRGTMMGEVMGRLLGGPCGLAGHGLAGGCVVVCVSLLHALMPL